MVMRKFHIPHGKRKKYCPRCCNIDDVTADVELTNHRIHHVEFSSGGRGCFGSRPRIFEHWECQRCGSVHIV